LLAEIDKKMDQTDNDVMNLSPQEAEQLSQLLDKSRG
jgi:hypothetical protein